MSRVFNLLKFFIKTAAAKVEDLPNISWNDIPGETDAQKVEYVKNELAQLLQNSENPSYDIYAAIGALKYPEITDPQAHQRFQQIIRSLEVLSQQEKARYDAVLRLLDGNTDLLMQQALEQFKIKYIPEIATLMRAQRIRNPQPLIDVANIPASDESKQKFIEDLRETYARRLERTFQDQIESLAEELSNEQIAYIIQGTRSTSLEQMPDFRSTAIRIGKKSNEALDDNAALQAGIKILKKFQADTEKLTTIRVGNWQGEDDLMSNLYQNPEQWSTKFRELLSDQTTTELARTSLGMVTKEEVLDRLGYSRIQYPQEPGDIFFKPEIPHASKNDNELTPEQKAEKDKVKELIRTNPYNLLMLSKILEFGGFNENGTALDPSRIFSLQMENLPALGADWQQARGQIRNIRSDWEQFFGRGQGTTPEDMPDLDAIFAQMQSSGDETNWPLHVLAYVAKTICENNPNLFAQMVADSGAATMEEIRNQMGKRVLPDSRYTEDYNLTFRSQAERDIVEKMRAKFGLEVVPYPLGVPKIDGCNAAVSGFQIDFMIPADVISGWTQGQDGQRHPNIKERMIFIGEYFGYDRTTPKPVNVPDDDGFRDIDGEIAIIKRKDGSEIQAINGAELTVGEHYSLKTKWKKMTHDVMATLSGNATILIDKDSKDDNIMDELDKNSIIYQYKGGFIRQNAAQLLRTHIPNCGLENCQSKSYYNVSPQGLVFNQKEISRGAAFIRCCLADLDVQYAIKPALLARDEKGQLLFTRERVYSHYIKKIEIQNELRQSMRVFDRNRDRYFELTEQLEKVNEEIQALVEEVKKQQSTEKYQQIKTGLMNLLDLAQEGKLTDAQIFEQATRFIKPWVPFVQKRTSSNILELLYRIAISN